jgi:arylsulfatase A-like enzyme
VRDGDWKLIGKAQDSSGGELNVADKELFLSNLTDDPSERKNFAERNPEIVSKLKSAHDNWYAGATVK